MWTRKSGETFYAKIFICGNYQNILSVCNNYCKNGYCVSVSKVEYVYKYGQESGVCITLINYPRFPESKEEIMLRAEKLAFYIAESCNQGSFTIATPEETIFMDRRELINKPVKEEKEL